MPPLRHFVFCVCEVGFLPVSNPDPYLVSSFGSVTEGAEGAEVVSSSQINLVSGDRFGPARCGNWQFREVEPACAVVVGEMIAGVQFRDDDAFFARRRMDEPTFAEINPDM